MTGPLLAEAEHARERAMSLVVTLDTVATLGLIGFGLLAGSMTLVADGVRGVFVVIVEVYAWITMRRIHRGQFAEYEFGTGKIERLVNVAIALSLLAAAVWIAIGAFASLDRQPVTSGVFFSFALLIASYNLGLNLFALTRFVRANQGLPSVILESQIGARVVKSTSSVVVFAVVLLAGVIADPTVGNFLDVLGSLFVCVVMARTAARQLREAIPDLLDRSLADTTQVAVYQALAESFEEYEDVVDVRSRRSGRSLLVEIVLGFDTEATVGQVAALQARLSRQIHASLPDARVLLVPAVVATEEL